MTIALASTYLLFFEGCYSTDLDVICLLLVKNGHDLYDFFKRKYVSDLESIGNIDISSKFRFLEEHGLKSLTNEQFRELRNKVAHLEFEALEKGEIRIRDKTVNIVLKTKELCAFTREISVLLGEVLLEEKNRLSRIA